MREKILKLLNSGSYEDIIVGIELSYDLDIQEFESIFTKMELITPYKGLCIAFGRGDYSYHMFDDGYFASHCGRMEDESIFFNAMLIWYYVKYSKT